MEPYTYEVGKRVLDKVDKRRSVERAFSQLNHEIVLDV